MGLGAIQNHAIILNVRFMFLFREDGDTTEDESEDGLDLDG